MSLAHPWMLLLLLPWAWIAWKTGQSTGPQTTVPFLNLWPKSAITIDTARTRRKKPPWIWLLLIAALSAILAAAGPRFTTPPPMLVLVDQTSGRAWTEKTIAELRNQIPAPLDIRPFSLPLDDQPQIILTHRPITPHPNRLIIAPPITPPNHGIDRIGYSAGDHHPTSAILINPRGEGEAEIEIKITADNAVKTATHKTTGPLILPIPAPSDSITATILQPRETTDPFPEDDTLTLTKLPHWPRLETIGPIPEPIKRWADIFTKTNPPTNHSLTITISSPTLYSLLFTLHSPLPPIPDSSLSTLNSLLPLPLPPDTQFATPTPTTPPPGQILIQSANQSLLIRTTSPPGYWIGFHSPTLANQPEFPLFLAALVESLTGRGDFSTIQSPPFNPNLDPAESWRDRLPTFLSAQPQPPVSPAFAAISLGFLLLALAARRILS